MWREEIILELSKKKSQGHENKGRRRHCHRLEENKGTQ
jgi:hypothetical protein